jgi:hypothetical protein
MRAVPPDDAIASSVFGGGLLAHVFTPSLSHVRGTGPCLCLRRNAARCELFQGLSMLQARRSLGKGPWDRFPKRGQQGVL